MPDSDIWIQLENMKQRMGHVLDQLQQVHARLASTAVTADRVSGQLGAARTVHIDRQIVHDGGAG
jgi:hypothetical protein